MKVKYSDILKWTIELLIIMKLGFVKLLGSWIPMFASPYDTYPECVLYLTLTILSVLFTIAVYGKKVNSYLNIELLLALVALLGGIVNALNWNNLELMAAISSAMPYFYLLLSYPVYILLKKGCWNFEKFLDFILFWGTIANILKMLNCASWFFTGNVIWANLISNANWILNNSIRINPPFASLLIIPISYYKMSIELKNGHKIKYLFPIIISIAYSTFVHQARSVLLYQVITLVAMFVAEHVTSRKKIVRWFFVLVAAVLIINTSSFDTFVNSFSPDNSVSGGSTVARFSAIFKFANMYAKHPFWGIGFLEEAEKNVGMIGAGLGHLDDIGVLGSFFTLGIPFLLLAVFLLGRSFYLAYKVKIYHTGYALLLIGMSVILVTTGINISWFNEIYAFAMPLYLGILEYVNYYIKKYKYTYA